MTSRFMKSNCAKSVVTQSEDYAGNPMSSQKGLGMEGCAATCTEVRNSNPTGMRESDRVSELYHTAICDIVNSQIELSRIVATVIVAVIATVMSVGGMAAGIEVPGFKGFYSQVECRQVGGEHVERNATIEAPYNNNTIVSESNKQFSIMAAMLDCDPDTFDKFRAKMASEVEKMDSVKSWNMNGILLSKQEFSFAEDGSPLECANYIADAYGNEDGYTYVGHILYKYDEFNRRILAENVDLSNISNSIRYEYIYDNPNQNYTMQLCYLMDVNGEWVNYQMAKYERDTNGHATSEVYYSWSEDSGEWVPAQKKEAEYDDMGRMISFYKWNWNPESNSWTGYEENVDNTAFKWEYTENGDDALEISYLWENGEWTNYLKKTYEYNNVRLRTKIDWKYWNRKDHDWTGGDVWGRAAQVKYNQYETFEYDNDGRIVTDNVFDKSSGEYENTYRFFTTYNELEDGGVEQIVLRGTVSSNEFKPYKKEIQKFNRSELETYYGSFSMSNGEWMQTQEQIRSYMDDSQIYIGSITYSFNNGVRRNGSKELLIYSEDFDPALNQETPDEIVHWVGIGAGEADWKQKDKYVYTWGLEDVLLGSVRYDYLVSDGLRTNGFEMEFDFDADMSRVFVWPDSNKTDVYYENKILSSTEYVNLQYSHGVDEWDQDASTKRVYYYSDNESGVTGNTVDVHVDEVGRYNIAGCSVDKTVKGVIIIRYSDGSSRKVIAK